RHMHVYSRYNAVATAAGALGALATALPGLLQRHWNGAPSNGTWFWLFVPVALMGALTAARLSDAVEADSEGATVPATQLHWSRGIVVRLAGLFAADSFAGGFVVQAFLAYWFTVKYGTSVGTIGVVFFCVALLQTASFLLAPRLTARFGLLNTMVFTHLP